MERMWTVNAVKEKAKPVGEKNRSPFSFVIVSRAIPIFRIMFPRRHENCTPSKNGAVRHGLEAVTVPRDTSYSYSRYANGATGTRLFFFLQSRESDNILYIGTRKTFPLPN